MFDYKLLPFKMQQQDHEAAQVSQELCGGDVGRRVESHLSVSIVAYALFNSGVTS